MEKPNRTPGLVRFAELVGDEEGVTAIEYGLVAALVSVFIMVAIGAVGDAVVGLFDLTSNAFPD